jgi:6-phosphogluconolactonase (cycloisomerase 2 family)
MPITALYAAIGPRLVLFHLDTITAALTRHSETTLPAAIQYAWFHPVQPLLYVASSDRGPGRAGTRHHATAFHIDPATGVLLPHGEAVQLPSRPNHITTDSTGRFLLAAYNDPSLLTVHALDPDGRIGGAIPQPGGLDFGIYAHQVRVLPGDRQVVLVTRGNDATAMRLEDPGALKLFGLGTDGVLAPLQSVAPGEGFGFGPRHIDFHPNRPLVFVSVERQNQLQVYALEDDRLATAPVSACSTLAGPESPLQMAGAIHVHPVGMAVYVSNRSDWVAEQDGLSVQQGGENSIAVFATGPGGTAPRLVQSVDPGSFHIRTFGISPDAQLLVAAGTRPRMVQGADGLKEVPAALSLFWIGTGGTLDAAGNHQLDVGPDALFWTGMRALA